VAVDGAEAQAGGAPSFPQTVRGYSAPSAPAATAQEAAARRILEAQVRALGEAFNGDIGIAVRDVQSGWTTSFDGDTYFPQQSVSKFWVALTALDKADRGELSLTAPVTVTKADITLFHQPIVAQIGAGGYSTTIGDLIYRAITTSDNTCNDFVLWKSGGPDAVRSFLRSRGIDGIRFGPGERLLQSQIAGIQWQQSWAYNGGFYKARNALPLAQRRVRALHRQPDGRSDSQGDRRGAGPAEAGRAAVAGLDAEIALDHGQHQDRGASSEGRAPARLASVAQDRHRPGARRRAGWL
jgi:beta-lactamase class A